jgi:carboxylesterase type B
MSYWTNFIKKLDPNGANLAPWKPFSFSDDSIMVFDKNVGMRVHPRAAQVNFLQQHAGR